MTTKFLPDGLFPGRLWFYRRLKIYVWAALGTASAFLFVAGWMPEGGIGRQLVQNFPGDLWQPRAGLLGVSLIGGRSVPRHDTPSSAAGPLAPPESTSFRRKGQGRGALRQSGLTCGAGRGVHWRGGCGVWWRSELGDCGPGGPENNAALANREVGLGINGGGEVQRLEEVGPEGPEPRVASSELGVQGGPADLNVALQGMQAVGKPDVDVDHHGAGADGPQGALAKAVRGGHGAPGRILR